MGKPWKAMAWAASCLGACSNPNGPPDPAEVPSVIVEYSTKPGDDRPQPSIEPSLSMLPAVDPGLTGFDGWPLRFDARFHEFADVSCRIAIERDGAELVSFSATKTPNGCETTWNGRDASGSRVTPGGLTVRGDLLREGALAASATSAGEIVALGVSEIQLEGDRVPYIFRATAGESEGFFEIDSSYVPWRLGPDASEGLGATVLELPTGARRESPPSWDSLLSPPLDDQSTDGIERDEYNLPTVWVAGSDVIFDVVLNADANGAVNGGAPQQSEIRVVAPIGLELISGDATFTSGAHLRFRSVEPPAPAVGVYEREYAFGVEVRGADGLFHPLPGAIHAMLRFYGVVDQPIFDFDSMPHRAWIDVVDQVARWVEGSTVDVKEVGSQIVAGIYYDLGLHYDRERGASHYTAYPGDWDSAVFDLTAFQDRRNGTTINCSDAASILSAYANMVGVDFRYHILTHRFRSGFDLNFIQAIGYDFFSETPFTSGTGGFRYHAIVGPPDGTTFDATLALDGDGIPTALPATLLLPTGLPLTDYLTALSSESADVQSQVDRKVRIQ